MRFKHITALLLITALFLVGCTTTTEPTTGNRGAYLGGTEGLSAEFEPFGVEESGKYTIFDTETFPIEVTVRNKGEYELQVGDVRVELIGPATSEISGIPTYVLNNQDIIDKVSELVPEGGEEIISFSGDAKFNTPTSGVIERNWFANVEYNYQTEVIIPEVCLKEDLTDDRVCEVAENKEFFVSGAPITIRNVEESTAGRGIMALKIAVANVGNGEVTKPGTEFGVRDTLAYTIDDPDWECKSSGQVNEARLINGAAEIICRLKQPLAPDTLSTKQVKLTLNYVYRDLIQETLVIKESQ